MVGKVAMSGKRLDEDLKQFAELAVRMGVVETRAIDPKSIVVKDWVRLKCQYGCGNYGRSLTCPPYSPTPEQMRKVLKGYSHAILMRVPDESTATQDTIAKLERHVFLSGYHSAFGLVAGPCERCKKCKRARGIFLSLNLQHCVYPRLARPSLESCGIDVYATARKNGFHIEVLRTQRQKPTYFGLLLVQ